MLDEIKEYFSEQRGKQFDPDLVDIFFSNIEEFLLIQSRFPEDTKLAS